MLRTVLAFQVATLCRTCQQCFIVPISKPEEGKLQKIKMHICTVKPH